MRRLAVVEVDVAEARRPRLQRPLRLQPVPHVEALRRLPDQQQLRPVERHEAHVVAVPRRLEATRLRMPLSVRRLHCRLHPRPQDVAARVALRPQLQTSSSNWRRSCAIRTPSFPCRTGTFF